MRRFLNAVSLLGAVVLLSSLSLAKQQEWVEVRSPNFIVVSNAGEKQARKAAVQFEQIRAVFRQTITIASTHPSPTITVLAVKDEGSMRDLLPEYWVKGHAHPAGLFAAQFNQFYAAVQLDAQTGNVVPGRSPYEAFYHEYYHTISLPYVPNLPLWLAEGLAEFFGHTNIEEKSVTMGDDDPLLLAELRNTSLIALNTLFQVDRTSPYYNENNKTSIFYAESWALTHYFMLGDRGAHKSMLLAYLQALASGKTVDEAASLAFGDLKKLQSDLQKYIHLGTYFHFKFPPPTFSEEELKTRPLSVPEAQAYRAGFTVARGQPQLAATALQEVVRSDPNLALGHQNLAFAEFAQGQHDKALESVSKAIALDPKNSFTRYLRAYLKTRAGSIGSTDPQIEDDLRQAIAISPDFAPPYGLLAVHLAAGNRNLDEASTLANKAVSFEPANSSYQLALAQVLVHQNKLDEADLASRHASEWARDPAEKANADNFRQFLASFRKLQTEMAAAGAGPPQILTPQQALTASPSDRSPMPQLRSRDDPSSAGVPANPFTASILRVQSKLRLVSNPMGVDFGPYFKDLMAAIQKNLLSSVNHLHVTEPKEVALELAISKDGTISGMRIASSSGDDALDQATQSGIRASSPLPPLPPAFKGKSVELRLQFSYSQERD
jgi:TonB family protein